MTEAETQLLIDLQMRKISEEEFFRLFPVDVKHESDYTNKEVRAAMQKADADHLEVVMQLIWLNEDPPQFIDLLNELLVAPSHYSHQAIAKYLQDHVKSPSSIPFIHKALDSGFDYLEYTASESDVIAKWFSWLLYAIGTDEAIDVIKEYSHSADDSIRNEMLYRLSKIKQQ